MNSESPARGAGMGLRAAPCPVCPLCRTTGVLLHGNLRDELYSAPGVWTLKRCPQEACGLLWLDPMPLAEDLAAAYSSYYTHGEPPSSAPKRLAKSLYRLSLDVLLSIGGIPAERRRAQRMFLDGQTPGTLLDVGCGHGTFIAEMAARGWKVAGVDFDPAAVEAARRQFGLVDVQVGMADTMVEAGRTFDVVTASHVIEHVPDPVRFLQQCRRLLRPGGRVVLRTPNAGSLGARLYGRAWRGLEPPRHLHIFTLPALDACAREAGFAGRQCFTTSVGAEFILIASHFLARKGSFRSTELSRLELLEGKLLAPLLALRAKAAWMRDKTSGEEICAVLTHDPADLAR